MDLSARTQEALDWPYLRRALAGHARTAAGRRLAEAIDLSEDLEEIEASFDVVEEIESLRASGLGLPPVGGVEDIAAALAAARRGDVLELEDLVVVRLTVGALERLGGYLDRHAQRSPALAALGAGVGLDAGFCAKFEAAIDDEGGLSEAAYPVLAELRRRMATLERRMRQTVEGLLDAPEFADVLQDRYVTLREGRFVLPIKAQAKGMGLGIVHDASRTRQTLFLEPAAVVPIGNEWRVAEFELRSEELRIRAELTGLLASQADAVAAALAAAATLDVAVARAAFAVRLKAVRPLVGREGTVDLRAARHPILALADAGVVANDLCLAADRPVLLLTGPNAGGKTVAMKTVGLAALLVRAGCFVPAAAGSRVDLFPVVVADIGDSQTVHEGLSSFSAHLATLRAMLDEVDRGAGNGQDALVLLDEIAAGTDPAQGGALARALVERFADAGARVVVTTHYAQLKAMPASDPRVAMAALEYREGQPTYRVVPGLAGESHALAAARRAGLEEALIERAEDLMGDAERALHEALTALEAERERATAHAARAEQAAAELAGRELVLAAREQTIKLRARQLEEAAARDFLERLRAADREVEEALAALRAGPGQAAVARTRTLIRESRAAARLPDPKPAAAPTRSVRVGDRVRVLGLGALGDVVAERDGEFEVRAGAMILRVGADRLEILGRSAGADRGATTGSRRGSRAHARRSAAADGPPDDAASGPLERAFRTVDNTVDLRGLRVDEGLARLEKFLDASMLAGRDAVFVLHGHGTGAMKAAVRRVLRESRYVSSIASAAENQGGDALTVAILDD